METNVWKFIWNYVKPMKMFFLALFILFSLSILIYPTNAYIASKVIGMVSSDNAYEISGTTWLFYLICFLAINWCATLCTAIEWWLEEVKLIPYYQAKVSIDLFKYTHLHSIRFFNYNMSGNISAKVSNVVSGILDIYKHILFGILRPVLMIVPSIVLIGMESLSLATVFFIITVIFMSACVYLRRKITPLSIRYSQLNSKAQGFFIDSIANANLVKGFGNYNYECLHFFCALKEACHAMREESKTTVILNSLTVFIFENSNALFYVLAFVWWYFFGLSISGIVLVITMARDMSNSITNVSFMSSHFADVYGRIKDALNLLAQPYEVKDAKNAKTLKVKNPEIKFANIKYRYKNNPLLFNNFELTIKPYEKIGLVGASGAGKSTLIKLLMRYYDITGGKILIDGKDISKVTQASLHKAISYVPQEASLFNRSIMENIRYGKPKASDEEVITAAKKAYCHEFIMKLPNGYDSKVGERGVMLSGGERQRIAIARAILSNAPILVLDEATSALDSLSERYIQQSLRELMENKTVIAIAHRLSTLKEMDRLIVLENGKVIESGSHKELLAQKGSYYKFYNLQSEGFIHFK